MLVSVKVFYNKCPTCKETWSVQLSQANVVRIGKETYTCKCGTVWQTGRVEWAHLTPKQRRGYFLSTAEIGVLILGPFAGGLFSFFIAQNKTWGLTLGLLGGFLVGALFVLPMWALKYTFVRLSLARCAPDRLSTPTGTDFLDMFRDTQEQLGDSAGETSEPSLQSQFRSIPARSWVYLLIGLVSFVRIEWFWPAMLLGMFLFARSLRKLA